MDLNSKVNISKSGKADKGRAMTTNLKSGQPVTTSPNNTLATFSNPFAPLQGAQPTLDQPLASSVDKGAMQL